MKSFPSSTIRGGSHLNPETANSSLKDTLINSFNDAITSTISGMTSGQGLDTEGIQWDSMPDYKEDLKKFDFISGQTQVPITNNLLYDGQNPDGGSKIENVYRMGNEVFDKMNNYRGYFENVAVVEDVVQTVSGSGKNKSDQKNITNAKVIVFDKMTPSLFNPMYGLISSSITDNVPLIDDAGGDGLSDFDDAVAATITDCSIKTLVEISRGCSEYEKEKESQEVEVETDKEVKTKDGKTKTTKVKEKQNIDYETINNLKSIRLGGAKYKYADFMYCKHLGQVSNNHLITLRKYAVPIGDDITSFNGNPSDVIPDIARMVTWFGTEDNKIEDIMSYDVEASWKELKAEHEEKQSQEEDAGRGKIGPWANLLSSTNQSQVLNGTANPNPWIAKMLGPFGGQATYANNDAALGSHYDKNKIYDPINTIRSTHLYEGELKFNHDINLKFSYKLRAYDNINPKSAFLDLLSNILVMTYKNGNFWSGSRAVLGAATSASTWNKAESLIGAAQDKIMGFFEQICNGSFDISQIMGSLSQAFSQTMGQIQSAWNDLKGDNVIDKAKDGAKKFLDGVGGDLVKGIAANAFGAVHNKLGRPAIYAFNSMVSGDNVGLWHLTVGNPLNPIATFGNLILTKAKITHSGPLGIDDFPTELQVQITLKHARPRDMSEIQRMYTKGKRQIYYAWANEVKGVSVGKKVLNDGETPSWMTTSPDYFYTNDLDTKQIAILRNQVL